MSADILQEQEYYRERAEYDEWFSDKGATMRETASTVVFLKFPK